MNNLIKIVKKTYGYFKLQNYSIDELYDVVPKVSINKNKRINLCITSMNEKDVYAGIRSAIDFFLCFYYQNKDIDFRIIVMRQKVDEKQLFFIENFVLTNNKEDSNAKFQIVDITESEHELFVRENDIFIATMWYTALNIQTVIEWQKESFSKLHDLIYLIQDFEPGFYPWSSKYLLAESSYKYQNVKAVFNSGSLHDFFVKNNYEFSEMYYFNPTLNKELQSILLKQEKNTRSNKLLFYGRPSKNRNAYELIILSFKYLIEKHPEIVKDWEIISIGEDIKDMTLTKKFTIRSKGKMTIKEYAELMLNSKIGISLMASPHPSYPPLEMSTFGMKVITNSFQNKNLSDFNNNIISVNNLNPKFLAEEIYSIMIEESIKENPDNLIPKDLNSEYVNGNNDIELIVEKISNQIFY